MEPAELRGRRRELQLTQSQLGRALGVSANTIARWERGDLHIRHAEMVAAALDNLDSQGKPPHNLPAEMSSFVGREKQVAHVVQRLETSRLLTLTGPGGVGKTRLALTIAHEVLPHHRGGVWLVDLSRIADPSLLGLTIASTLGVKQRPGQSVAAALTAATGQKRLLLVLDNCEHLVEECAELASVLLRSCPNLRILATSREILHVPGETRWQVPPLSIPESASIAPEEALRTSEAVQLFLERARAVVPSFVVTPDNYAAVAEVCIRLDGLPLALELAAARLNVLEPREIVARLDARFRLLDKAPRTAPSRHQTLRAVLDWSYGLLTPSERTLFTRVAVFAGGWDLEAAAAVCSEGDVGSSDVLDALTRLVEKSLVTVTADAGPRFRLLETVRDYAWDCVGASDEADRLRERHAAYFLDFAKRLGTEASATGPEAVRALEQLRREEANLRDALSWAADTGNGDVALRMAGALAEVWYRLGSFGEGRHWLSLVLAMPGASAPTSERAWALDGAGWLAVCQGDYATALAMNEECLGIARGFRDPLLQSRALINLGVAAIWRGEYATARELLQEAHAHTRGTGDRIGTAMALMDISWLELNLGDYRAADAQIDELLALGQSLRSTWVTAAALTLSGSAAFARGELALARKLLDESLIAARASGDLRFIAVSLDALGNLALAEGDADSAGASLRESLQIRRDVGAWPEFAVSLESLAEVQAAVGQWQRALHVFAAATGQRKLLAAPQTERQHAAAQRWLARARAVLGDQSFDAALAAGRTMALDDLLSDALTGAGAMPTGSSRLTSVRSVGPLTSREREVVALVACGFTNKQIARELVITERTAENHLRHIFDKLGAATRAQVAAWAVAHEVLDPAQIMSSRTLGPVPVQSQSFSGSVLHTGAREARMRVSPSWQQE